MIEPTQPPIPDIPVPDVDSLVTEDDTPVDSVFSEKQMRLLAESLRLSWKGPGENRPFVVFANVGLFASDHEPGIVPDVMVAIDVRLPPAAWEKRKGSYFTWLYGKPPDIVIEVVSNTVGGEEEKLERYGRIGVPYVVIYDPDEHLTHRTLRVFQRHGLHYTEYLSPARLQDTGLGVIEWDGVYEDMPARWLRWVDDQGQMLATGAETAAQEKALRQAETARAEAEAQRAEAEAARAERLAARLRALGETPD